MADEPLQTVKDGEPGRPEYSEEQYMKWLEDMAPFLKMGGTLYYCLEKAGLETRRMAIYRKYNLKDWFCEKVDAYRQYPGHILNDIFTREIVKASDKLKQEIKLDETEWKNLRFAAEKLRVAQPYFATKIEQSNPEEVTRLLDDLETLKSDYAELGSQIKGQSVETNPPISNQG